ncbi:Alpha/Beta hydrolase protein [Clohesyomyces aquaticus]|uniref:Alpha/Beta hydrolase protein n=1 Tax=Clohesyomyces aquaticus TaxID=1231657 RepID=A0A1Y1ZQB1_9PLEO|nr:Alpha/Beta hydrolase protein [Clohesyomyces aquaticus]
MPLIKTNDNVTLYCETNGSSDLPPLILLHGFTSSGAVFLRNVEALSRNHYVVVPDLRGHGFSDKTKSGYHVARLALDLKNVIDYFQFKVGTISAIGTSLGAAILWSYCELFTTEDFKSLIFVDQAPLQNYLSDWGAAFGNRGCNSAEALQAFQKQLLDDPKAAHLGTINACLAYRYAPQPGDFSESSPEWKADEEFFLSEALKGDPWWYGKLMADHTALDWRDSIAQSFGENSGSTTRVLVVASTRSGCFPAAGPLKVQELASAESVTVEWGGHWCYWEQPDLFNEVAIRFLLQGRSGSV